MATEDFLPGKFCPQNYTDPPPSQTTHCGTCPGLCQPFPASPTSRPSLWAPPQEWTRVRLSPARAGSLQGLWHSCTQCLTGPVGLRTTAEPGPEPACLPPSPPLLPFLQGLAESQALRHLLGLFLAACLPGPLSAPRSCLPGGPEVGAGGWNLQLSPGGLRPCPPGLRPAQAVRGSSSSLEAGPGGREARGTCAMSPLSQPCQGSAAQLVEVPLPSQPPQDEPGARNLCILEPKAMQNSPQIPASPVRQRGVSTAPDPPPAAAGP